MTVEEFFAQMKSDVKETNDMVVTEQNLIKAIEEYEKSWKTKIKVIHDPSQAH